MKSKIKLQYITYQTFPSRKANTLQTIGNLDYLSKNGVDVSLLFPLREVQSTADESTLKSIYGYSSNINLIGTTHKLPFGKINKFVKLSFIISHYMWSRKIVLSINRNPNQATAYFTRSEWVFYYLSKYNFSVIYECHQLSKIKKIIIPISIKKPLSKIIFLNNELKIDANIKQKYESKTTVLQNGVDEKLFKYDVPKDKKKVIFSGNLSRFNSERNLDFILDAFLDTRLNDYSLNIVGASESEYNSINKTIKENGLSNKVKLQKWVDRKKSILEIQKSSIGVLINSDNNLHSIKYTSPLKYFEYLYAGLSVVAVNFKAHKILPYSESINFFDIDNKNQFIEAILKASVNYDIDKNRLTLDFRSKKIIKFLTN